MTLDAILLEQRVGRRLCHSQGDKGGRLRDPMTSERKRDKLERGTDTG